MLRAQVPVRLAAAGRLVWATSAALVVAAPGEGLRECDRGWQHRTFGACVWEWVRVYVAIKGRIREAGSTGATHKNTSTDTSSSSVCRQSRSNSHPRASCAAGPLHTDGRHRSHDCACSDVREIHACLCIAKWVGPTLACQMTAHKACHH